MTILQPRKNRTIHKFLSVLFVLMIIVGGIYIFEYGTLADYRHQIILLKQDLIRFQVQNTDLRGQLYAKIDPTALESFAIKEGFILEKKPSYLVTTNQWPSDLPR